MSAVIQIEPSLFKNVHAALAFAFNYRHGQVKRPYLATLAGGPTRSGRGLGGTDGAGQAGMIKAEVQAMAKFHGSIVIARFSQARVPCSCKAPCCNGYRLGEDWGEAVDALAEEVKDRALDGLRVNYQLRKSLVVRFLELREMQDVTLKDIAKTCGVNRDTAGAHNAKIVACLREGERLAMYEVEGRLKQAGIIE